MYGALFSAHLLPNYAHSIPTTHEGAYYRHYSNKNPGLRDHQTQQLTPAKKT